MSKSKIGTVEAIMLILTVVIIHSICSLPIELLVTTKSATILNLIYISIIVLVITNLIVLLFKRFPGQDIVDISEFVGGKIFKNVVGIILISYFLISASILLRNFCETLKLVYFPMTDLIYIILLFIITLCISNRLSVNSTLKTTILITPLVLGSIVFLFFANMNKFIPQRIFPILGDGLYTTFIAGLINIYSFGGIIYLFFLPPLLKEPEKLKKITNISVIITSIYLILCVSSLLFMFSFFSGANEMTPLYNAARYIEFRQLFSKARICFFTTLDISF